LLSSVSRILSSMTLNEAFLVPMPSDYLQGSEDWIEALKDLLRSLTTSTDWVMTD
jgi:hypothetical protein